MKPQYLLPPIVLIVMARGGVALFQGAVKSYENWRRTHADAAEGLETAIGLAIAGAFLFVAGALALMALGNTEAEGWKILGNLSMVVGLAMTLKGAYSSYQKTQTPDALTPPRPHSVVYPGTLIRGRPSPQSTVDLWSVQTINDETVLLASTRGAEIHQMTRPIFDASLGSGALSVVR